jgi:hypothetical protein
VMTAVLPLKRISMCCFPQTPDPQHTWGKSNFSPSKHTSVPLLFSG